MTTYISVIFNIVDRFRKRALLAPEASILMNGRRLKPLYKPGGYFVFTDLEPGEACFEIASPIFQKESVDIDIPMPGEGYIMNHLMLNPSRLYPFGGPATTVSGRLMKGKMPLPGQKFHIIPGDGGEVLKIAEDKAEEGNCSIKLFATVPGRQLSIPGRYLIKNKDDAKKEFCLITQNADKDGMYALEKELLYSHPRATPLVEVIECITQEDGSFYTALPELKEAGTSLNFLIQIDGKSIKKTFEIKADIENNIPDIGI